MLAEKRLSSRWRMEGVLDVCWPELADILGLAALLVLLDHVQVDLMRAVGGAAGRNR